MSKLSSARTASAGKTQEHPLEVFCKTRCSFANFTGKHLCWSLFFNKVRGIFKVFSCEIAKFSRTPILKNICKRLLLKLSYDSMLVFRMLLTFNPLINFSLACSNNPFTANTEDGGLPCGETIPREFEDMTRSWVQVINYTVGTYRKIIQRSVSNKLC